MVLGHAVFRLATLKWRSKCMEPRVLTRLGTFSGSVAPEHWQSLPGAVAGLGRIDVGGRSWIVRRWRRRRASDRRTEKAALLFKLD